METARDAERLFNAAIELMHIISKEHDAKVERQKKRRREKAKARYAIRKAAGTLPKKTETIIYDPEPHTSCHCSTCAMPPCGWCESHSEPD